MGAASTECTGMVVAEAGIEATTIHSKRLALALLQGIDHINTQFNPTTMAAADELCVARPMRLGSVGFGFGVPLFFKVTT